jgi:hypothetical protein
MTDTVSLNECRNAFENERKQYCYTLARHDDLEGKPYIATETRHAWSGWQAAWNIRPSSPICESLVEKLEATKGNGTQSEFHRGWNSAMGCACAIVRQHQAESIQTEQSLDDQSEPERRATALYEDLLKANKRIAELSRGYSDAVQVCPDCDIADCHHVRDTGKKAAEVRSGEIPVDGYLIGLMAAAIKKSHYGSDGRSSYTEDAAAAFEEIRPYLRTTEPGGLLDPDMPVQELRLHMGELSGNEALLARAAIRWSNTRHPEPVSVSLEICEAAYLRLCANPTNYSIRNAIKAILEAAGVQYVD